MQVTLEEVHGLVEGVWTTVLGLDVHPSPDADVTGDVLTGVVEVRGAWEGAVALDCPAGLAREVAGVMFGTPPGEVSEEQARDALGELVNILGGSLKAMLPGPSSLGLPVVEGGTRPREASAGQHLFQAAFSRLGQPFRVTVVEHRTACAGQA